MIRLIIAVALVAIGAGTAYYFYVTKKPKGCLDPEKFNEFKLIKRSSHLLSLLQLQSWAFQLDNILVAGRDDLGEEVIKPYTPATLDSDIGYFELVIKGRFKYQPGQVEAFGTLAGDTGIAPMFQVARAILENPNDKTNVYLIYANVTFYDILLKPPQEWDGGVGFISKEMILTHCPAPASDIQILRCGPPPTNKAMAAHLKDLGYTPQMQFQFGAFDELPPILDVTLFTASISLTHILSM
ncbi:hypothetical protein WN944_009977 [Citrus x changshan-huyou]|uniref:Oxidoreductase FAD/NAD(P)-binding domain-containing protein n=1 Tax=Citrus x changshan-huyou TaxID=2935761 RepID=A0AAP0MQS7_9ROSI